MVSMTRATLSFACVQDITDSFNIRTCWRFVLPKFSFDNAVMIVKTGRIKCEQVNEKIIAKQIPGTYCESDFHRN